MGKVIDFGVACFHSAERMAKSSDRMLVGSLAYMAPERFARSPGGHWRWDIYALGASMYRCLAGRSLMANRGIGEVMGLAASSVMWNKHVVKAMRRVRDDTPPDLWPLMLQCLRHEGHARPTGGELGERLEECARGLEGPGLRAWAAGLNWRHRHEDGALTGKSLAIEPLQMGVPEGFGPEV